MIWGYHYFWKHPCSQNHPNNLSCQTIASSCFSRFPDGLGKKVSGCRLGLQGLGEAGLISSIATRCKISQRQGLEFFSTPSWQHLVCLGALLLGKLITSFCHWNRNLRSKVKTAAGCYNRVRLTLDGVAIT